MCGRFVVARSTGDLVAALGVEHVLGDDLRPSWNVAPTQKVRIVTGRGPEGEASGRRLETARWGLVPVWAKSRSDGARAINARSETVLEKPTFRSAAVKRRALVPADGYYEWSGEKGSKIPTYLHGRDEEPLAFAGLYEFWRDPEVPDGEEGEWLMTTTILTRPATDALGHIHDRTPVIIPPAHVPDPPLVPGESQRRRPRGEDDGGRSHRVRPYQRGWMASRSSRSYRSRTSASNSAGNSREPAAALPRACSGFLAPGMIEEISGREASQARATCAGVASGAARRASSVNSPAARTPVA